MKEAKIVQAHFLLSFFNGFGSVTNIAVSCSAAQTTAVKKGTRNSLKG
jgi:hypothetical protein